MSTEIKDEFALVAKTLNAPDELSTSIAITLQSYLDKYNEYNSLIDQLVINDINDTGKMSMAREGRLDLRRKRIEAEKLVKEKRDELKNKMANDLLQDKIWLKSGQLIVSLFETLENKLLDKEKFAETEIQRQKELKADQRKQLMLPYLEIANPDLYDLKNMPDEQFEITLAGIRHSYELKKEAEKKEAEKKTRFFNRREELFVLKFPYSKEGFAINNLSITDKQLMELEDEDFLKLKNEGIDLIAKEIKKREEEKQQLEKLKEEQAKKAEQESLQRLRLNELLPYASYGEGVDMTNLWELSDKEFKKILFAKKELYDIEQKKIVEDKIKADIEKKRLQELEDEKQKKIQEQEELNSGSDKQRFVAFLDSMNKAYSDMPEMKSKKMKAISEFYRNGFTALHGECIKYLKTIK